MALVETPLPPKNKTKQNTNGQKYIKKMLDTISSQASFQFDCNEISSHQLE
jgi:hypothetical protein